MLATLYRGLNWNTKNENELPWGDRTSEGQSTGAPAQGSRVCIPPSGCADDGLHQVVPALESPNERMFPELAKDKRIRCDVLMLSLHGYFCP